MQTLALNCDYCESRRDQGIKPFSYLGAGLGEVDEGIPKESAFFAQFSLDSAVDFPSPATLILTSAHI